MKNIEMIDLTFHRTLQIVDKTRAMNKDLFSLLITTLATKLGMNKSSVDLNPSTIVAFMWSICSWSSFHVTPFGQNKYKNKII